MARLDIEKQEKLEPKRIEYAKKKIESMGYDIDYEDSTKIKFIFRGCMVTVFPYSGWFSGKSVKDGRGIKNLLGQIKTI